MPTWDAGMGLLIRNTTVSAPSGYMDEIFIAYMTNGTVSC